MIFFYIFFFCCFFFFFLMIRRPPRSTLFPYRRSSDLAAGSKSGGQVKARCAALGHSPTLEWGTLCRQDYPMTMEHDAGDAALTHLPLRPGSTLSRIAGERAERSEAGEGLAAVEAPADRSDIHQNDWVECWLPVPVRPYARLARLDRPIGTWLLLFPGWWGIALASRRWPDPVLLLLFAIGAVAMRGAGCTLNVIADRDYDGQVARTQLRPLPSGAISVCQAMIFLLLQLTVGAAVLFSLNRTTILLGAAVLGLIATYPFMK